MVSELYSPTAFAVSPRRDLRCAAPSPRRRALPGRLRITARAVASPREARLKRSPICRSRRSASAAEQTALLDRLGLKRIGQLIGKPRAPLAARFGIDLVSRLDQALGHLDEVLSPRRPAPSLSAERRFAEPVVDSDSLLQTVASLAKNLVPTLERHGLGARLLEAAFFRIDGEVFRVEVGTAAPLRAPDAMSLLFSERLSALESEWDAGFGFDMVRLAVLRSEPLSATQIDLAGEEGTTADLTHLYDRLGARLGPARITRYLPVDTHIPERAVC